MELQLQEQMAQFQAMEEEQVRLRQEKEDILQTQREKVRKSAVEAAKAEEWQFKGKIAEHTKKLEAQEKKALAEAKQRIIAERSTIVEEPNEKAKRIEEKKAQQHALAEANFRQESARLEEKAKLAQQELDDATQACEQQEADIAETQRKVRQLHEARAQAFPTV